MNVSYGPVILKAIYPQKDERRLRDILARIPEKDRAAQVNEPWRGKPPLIPAAASGRIGLTNALLEAGALVDGRHRCGWTALHIAAMNGHAHIAKQLIEHGSAVDVRDEHGNTPLMTAVENDQPDAVEVLLEAGADTTIVNHRGETAEEVAQGEAQQVLVAHRERIVLRNVADVSEEPAPCARRHM